MVGAFNGISSRDGGASRFRKDRRLSLGTMDCSELASTMLASRDDALDDLGSGGV